MESRNIKIAISVVLVVIFLFILFYKKPEGPSAIPVVENPVETATTTEEVSTIVYRNSQYGFDFTLPKSWGRYLIIEEFWEGYSLDINGNQVLTESGPFLSIRHPDWDYKSPRQDIPIYVFTMLQWDNLQKDLFHIGASPVNPIELGRNSKYVFALPARYNFSFLSGYEEVEDILKTNPLRAF